MLDCYCTHFLHYGFFFSSVLQIVQSQCDLWILRIASVVSVEHFSFKFTCICFSQYWLSYNLWTLCRCWAHRERERHLGLGTSCVGVVTRNLERTAVVCWSFGGNTSGKYQYHGWTSFFLCPPVCLSVCLYDNCVPECVTPGVFLYTCLELESPVIHYVNHFWCWFSITQHSIVSSAIEMSIYNCNYYRPHQTILCRWSGEQGGGEGPDLCYWGSRGKSVHIIRPRQCRTVPADWGLVPDFF